MNLKLTNRQFFKLYDILGTTVMGIKPIGINQRLYHSILVGLYKKFYTKAFHRDKKNYSISLNDEQACAWFLFFNSFVLPKEKDKEEEIFKAALLLTINNNIHQKFSV